MDLDAVEITLMAAVSEEMLNCQLVILNSSPEQLFAFSVELGLLSIQLLGLIWDLLSKV